MLFFSQYSSYIFTSIDDNKYFKMLLVYLTRYVMPTAGSELVSIQAIESLNTIFKEDDEKKEHLTSLKEGISELLPEIVKGVVLHIESTEYEIYYTTLEAVVE